ncbi:T-complex protein 1 subunit alpha, putative [Plasmodium berghei]|uniref:T-complex protein 1 subunit alpha n=2 Tax=Plasmodium berghei TaxID=5821 RepID=A0A509AI32_PLABA|nr:T-complex protein 1 subunit alpha, putative [Plasmodium berghei ANKA]CXI42037.1 T-complex protein 1 subunit alpha, putative [Plasmodium berghei]SCM22028.1 T-complex protein 1 subunit alpha, putative [Plasmodium berghei]SCN25234.1 T-complex protein 1 subunit alpha, putative [Plasmodium berghei]SCO60223.1 T-complex protein 1 subunit alpha, putative [Plasmodium berghei]SCO61855.1 T-complex protein 1 subunit alpha, putative [Plasmodium berghei]|eukprot:XP_034421513.1 T-complex protein 1 subunit alpha, putative [Plasmodium berghei ANKA]
MSLSIYGNRENGQDVRTANVTAVQALSNILKSSLGPQGLDKMLVDNIGDVTITNDGATILKQLEIQHPAAKILVNLSELQDQEVGDGTTSVVLLASELLRRGNELIKMDIHPTTVICGYKLAMKESVKYIKEKLSERVTNLGKDVITNIAKTTLSSKFISYESEYFAKMVSNAIQSVKIINDSGKTKYPVSSVNILKVHGLSSLDSKLIDGYAIMSGRASQSMPSAIKNAKIAFLDFPLKQYRLHLGVQVNINDPNELEKIRQREKDITKERVNKILESGANVILTTQGIDDMPLKYFVEAGAIAVRRIKKDDLKRIAKLTNGQIRLTLSSIDGTEKFEPASLGYCDEVYEEKVGDWDVMFFKGCKNSKSNTILLRGANDFVLDEMERSIHDALCSVSRALESNYVVVGGGCVEVALSVYLEDFAKTLGSREQLAIAEFAESLLIIPKILALNASYDSIDLVCKLRAYHTKSQVMNTDEPKDYRWYGLDLVNGKVANNLKNGVLEAMISKIKSIRFATEATITILRIDDLIKLVPEEPKQEEP